MKRAHCSILASLVVLTLVCLRAWPQVGVDARAATSVEAAIAVVGPSSPPSGGAQVPERDTTAGTTQRLVITCPSDATIECDEPSGPSNTGQATAVGTCGTPQVSYADAAIPGNCPHQYTIQRTWTAIDECGGSTSCVQMIDVEDNAAPVITCPADITISSTEPTDPSHTGMATATDNCDTSVTVTYSDVGSSPGPDDPYTIERTWTATDDCGRDARCVQIITVLRPTATRPSGETPTPTRPTGETPTPTRPTGETPTPTRPAGCERLTADFDWAAFCTINFTFSDKSATSPSDPINSWHWDFGDGATSTLQNPAHAYAQGLYDVTLTVRTRSGCQASVTKQVEVARPEWVFYKELVHPVGGPVYVGDEVTYRLVVGAVPPYSILDFSLTDHCDMQYFEFVSASPPPDDVWLWPSNTWGKTSTVLQWHHQGPGPTAAGAQREYYITLRVKDEIGPPVQGDKCNHAQAGITFAPNDCAYFAGSSACVEAEPPPSALTLRKTLLEPASGVAQVGDVASFLIEARNVGTTPIPDFEVWDSFLDAEYEFVFASPAPTNNTSDGTNHTLIWDNLSLPPGGAFAILLELRAKMPGVLTNCARTVEWVDSGIGPAVVKPLFGSDSCASVEVDSQEGKDFAVWKKFVLPTNHVANVGDSVQFSTKCWITGSEPAVEIQVVDHLAPPSVLPASQLWSAAWSGVFPTGDYRTLGVMFAPASIASPAVNTAEWTVTWPDGTRETKIAQDHVYIVDGDIGKGLFIDKSLLDPLAGAAISDTVRFRIAITNVTGIDLLSLPLEDTFPAQCLSFVAATRSPDQVLPGKLVWNDLGPLPSEHMMAIEAWFHADAVCPAALNCASSVYSLSGAAAQTVADCEPVTIRGDQPRLVLSKQRTSPSPAHMDDLVTWQIVLENVGTARLAVIPLHDAYQSALLQYQSAVPAPDDIDLAYGRLDWTNLGPLNPGQTVTVTLTLLAKAPGVGVLNCGQSAYTVGSSAFTPHDCDSVDIVARGPAIGVAKQLASPAPGRPLALGEVAAFTLTLRNTGPVTLTNVMVEDHFDPACLSFVLAGAMPPVMPGPGQLRWTFASLAPGETHSWQVLFHADQAFDPTHNCVVASGQGPEGFVVLSEDCLPLAIEASQPGLVVRKAMVAPSHVPQVDEVIEYELVVKNAGNTTLMTVDVTDLYDPTCLEYAAAMPGPDTVDTAAGRIHWTNVGPLAPGDAAILRVFLRGLSPCPFAPNCIEARWLVDDAPELVVADCVEVPIRAGAIETPTPTGEPGRRRFYLPIVRKGFPRSLHPYDLSSSVRGQRP